MKSILMAKAKTESLDNFKRGGYLIVSEQISPLCFLKINKAEKEV